MTTEPSSNRIDELFDHIKFDRADEVRRLVQVDPELAVTPRRGGQTAFHRACALGRATIVKILLEREVPIDCLDGKMTTALHTAVWHEQTEIVRMLLDAGADPERSSVLGYSVLGVPRIWLSERGNAIFVELLLAGAEIDLELAVSFGQLQVTAALLQSLGSAALNYPYSDDLLEIACTLYEGTHLPRLQERRHAMVAVLLKHGFSPNRYKDYPPLYRSVMMDDAACATELLNYGADRHIVVNGESLEQVAQRCNAQRVLPILRQFS